MTTAYLKAANELEKMRKENLHLKDLLEQVYEMAGLDEMINSGCLDRDDDEFLMSNLSLRYQIMEALDRSERPAAKMLKHRMDNGSRLSEAAKELKPLMTEDSIKFTNHKDSLDLERHYIQPKKDQ